MTKIGSKVFVTSYRDRCSKQLSDFLESSIQYLENATFLTNLEFQMSVLESIEKAFLVKFGTFKVHKNVSPSII